MSCAEFDRLFQTIMHRMLEFGQQTIANEDIRGWQFGLYIVKCALRKFGNVGNVHDINHVAIFPTNGKGKAKRNQVTAMPYGQGSHFQSCTVNGLNSSITCTFKAATSLFTVGSGVVDLL